MFLNARTQRYQTLLPLLRLHDAKFVRTRINYQLVLCLYALSPLNESLYWYTAICICYACVSVLLLARRA
jgi:hypothetical protein